MKKSELIKLIKKVRRNWPKEFYVIVLGFLIIGQACSSAEPNDTIGINKGASSQIYNNVGLMQYYFATGDERALSHIRKSVEIHRTYKAGYYPYLSIPDDMLPGSGQMN